MALTLKKRAEEAVGRIKVLILKVSFDASYPTGGEPLNLTQYGFKTVDQVTLDQPAGYVLSYDYVNKKILAYRQKNPADAGGADIPLPEVAAAVDLSALSNVRVTVWGT